MHSIYVLSYNLLPIILYTYEMMRMKTGIFISSRLMAISRHHQYLDKLNLLLKLMEGLKLDTQLGSYKQMMVADRLVLLDTPHKLDHFSYFPFQAQSTFILLGEQKIIVVSCRQRLDVELKATKLQIGVLQWHLSGLKSQS